MEHNTIHIEDIAWKKILGYARKTYDLLSTEIGGMAAVIKDDEDRWVIQDPAIMKQEVTATVCHLEKQALANWYGEVTEKYKAEASEDKLMYCWWHSHHDMTATMSATDWGTIGETSTGLSLVVNNKGEYQLILSIKDPMPLQIECDLENISQIEDIDGMEKEIKECVVKEQNSYYNGWGKKPFKSLRDTIADSKDAPNNQLTLYNNEYYDNILDEKSWNESFGLKEDDVTKSVKLDETYDQDIDDALINIDYQLEALNSGAVTPQEVIDDVENINKAFGNELLKVPSPEEVQKIKNAEELML